MFDSYFNVNCLAFLRLRSRERFFFSRQAVKFWGTTDEHGITRIFLRQSIFLRLGVFARESLLYLRKKILLRTGTPCGENFFSFAQTSRCKRQECRFSRFFLPQML